MASYNRVILMGNLTRDPEHKQLTSGQSVCRLGLASNRNFKNKQTGTMVQEVCFVDIDVWGAQADSSNQYLKKGSAVLIEGRLKFDTWQDNEGQKRNKHSIVADRVTFLPASAAQTEDSYAAKTGFNNSEKNVNKTTTEFVSNSAKNSDNNKSDEKSFTGEVNLKDKEPFEDDLPF
ncbi:single-stranded DNA-binding protein [Candidatus Dependentiae bacterium]